MHRKYHGRPGRLLQSLRRNAAPAKKTEAPAAKKEAVPAGKKSAKQEEHGGFRKNFGGSRDFRERGSFKRSDNPDVIFGRDFEEETIRIEQIMGEMGEVVIRWTDSVHGRASDPWRENYFNVFYYRFYRHDHGKNVRKDEYLKEIKDGGIAKGAFLKIKGVTTIDRFDSELTIGSVIGIKKIPSFVSTRMDTSPVKRVERIAIRR